VPLVLKKQSTFGKEYGARRSLVGRHFSCCVGLMLKVRSSITDFVEHGCIAKGKKVEFNLEDELGLVCGLWVILLDVGSGRKTKWPCTDLQ
jgi:hypothetical protein